MLRLLLDEHFSEQDAAQLRRHEPGIDVISVHTWESGMYVGAGDAAILVEAYRQGRTLVTRDLRTILPVLKDWAESGVSHGDVILVDHHAIPEGNTGALIKALRDVWSEEGDSDWTDQILYLRPTTR